MIKTKKDLKDFISYESKLYGKKRPYLFRFVLSEYSMIWKFVCLLRYEEYYKNCGHNFLWLIFKFLRLKHARKCGFLIPINVVDKGLKIAHLGPLIINAKYIGRNFLVIPPVNIVAGGHDSSNPIIGNDVCCGVGTTIVGGVKIGDFIAIGANSLVNKSFEEEHVTIAGNPAKIISRSGSETWGEKSLCKIN